MEDKKLIACETCGWNCEHCLYADACKVANNCGNTRPVVCNGWVVGEK